MITVVHCTPREPNKVISYDSAEGDNNSFKKSINSNSDYFLYFHIQVFNILCIQILILNEQKGYALIGSRSWAKVCNCLSSDGCNNLYVGLLT